VTTNQPITFGVHTSYITIDIVERGEKIGEHCAGNVEQLQEICLTEALLLKI
jgi:hypothetical protein